MKLDELQYRDELLRELQELGYEYSVDEFGTCADMGGDVIFEADSIEEVNNELGCMIVEIRNDRFMKWGMP